MKATSEIPSLLYKYMSEEYAHAFLRHGHVLFRNLTSFKQMENLARGDVREGCHVDNPPNDVVLSDPQTGRQIARGKFSMRTTIQTNRIFVLCMSKAYDERLFLDFDCGACVMIRNPVEFIRRCDRTLKRLLYLDRTGCVSGSVEYYGFDRQCQLDIIDPYNIPFLKYDSFVTQQEFRLCFGRRGAFKGTKRLIADQEWNTAPDHRDGIAKSHLLKIGNISDIADIRMV